MKQIKIKVTQADIDKGWPCNSCECAISQAARREHPEAKDVKTGFTYFHIDDKHFEISKSAQRFINAFDLGKPVKPQNFIFKARDF